jgi:hypothetical protein
MEDNFEKVRNLFRNERRLTVRKTEKVLRGSMNETEGIFGDEVYRVSQDEMSIIWMVTESLILRKKSI